MIKVTVLDEINCAVEGLERDEISEIVAEFSYPVQGAHMQAAFQLKQWDGKESIIERDGDVIYTYLFYMDEILDILQSVYRYKESEIEIEDMRQELPEMGDVEVPVDYMQAEFGHPYRDHQHAVVNTAVRELCGVLDAATSSGKTLICASIAKYFQPWFKSITIVPTDFLLKQTAKEFTDCGLDAIAISAKTPVKKRPQKIREHQHVVITWRLLNNIISYEEETGDVGITGEQFVVMYDELQEFGDTMIEAFRNGLHNCPIRFGMSGTVPDKDKLKKAHILGCIGGDVLETVEVRYLMDKGYASQANIYMVETLDKDIQEFSSHEAVKNDEWTWDTERSYYATEERVEEIADYISKLEPKNTLILCHPELGWKLSRYLETEMIDKDMDNDLRTELFSKFDDSDDHMFCATFKTVGTGVSANNILRGIIIDAGKNDTNIRQGIGRFIRLDGVHNEVDVIDISSDTYFAQKHRTERKRIYKKHRYDFVENHDTIRVS